MSKQVFISHSHSDADVANSICEIIEKQGISCWIAPRDVRPGKIWDDEIVDGIESCKAMIILVSNHSNNSMHVRKEIELALNQKNSIFPVLIQDVEPEKKLKFILTGIHWVNAWKPPLEEHLNELIQALQELLDGKKDDGKVKTVKVEDKIKKTPKFEGVGIKYPSMNIAQPMEDVKTGNKSIPAKTTAQEELAQTKKGIFQNPFTAGLRIPVYIFSVVLILIFLYPKLIKKDASPSFQSIGLKSIAVLPFKSIDRTEEGEIFSDGIHEDILTQIAKIHDLKVIARTSVIRYRNTDKSIREIAEELGVSSVLEGSVRRVGNRIRIVAQLIDSETEDHLWAETYDRDYADIFAIQSDVAQKIALALKATLTLQEKQSIEEIPTDNLKAYEYYLQAKITWDERYDLKDLESAVELFEKAIDLDPGFTAAYAKLSRVHLFVGWKLNYNVSEELIQQAKLALDKAIELDPTHPEVLIAEGYYYYWGFRDYKKALEKFSVALQVNPNDSDLLYAIGLVNRRYGKWDEALKLLIMAAEIDPRSYLIATTAGWTARYMRKWEIAEEFSNSAISINPSNKNAYIEKVNLAIYNKGDLKEAQIIINEALNHIHTNELLYIQSEIEYLSRNYIEALQFCQDYQDKGGGSDIPNFWDKGRCSLLIGNSELATYYFDSIVIRCEKILKSNPNDGVGHGYLAMAYARLGMKEKALSEAEIATNLQPMSFDAVLGTAWKTSLVDIYISIGEFDRAINEIEYLLSIPSPYSINLLKLEPLFDPIRNNRRFQKLLAKYE